MKSLWRCCVVVVLIGALAQIASAKIDINTASAAELESLPRIGPGLAQTIVDYREQHGPFNSIEDIKNVPRIGDKIYSEIKDLITTGGSGGKPSLKKESIQKSSPDDVDPMKPIEKVAQVQPTPMPTVSIEEVTAAFANEPTIQEVQNAAIRFAEVDPQRFASWRSDVRNRALLPDTFQVSVGHDTDDDTDYSKSKTISVSGNTVTVGPDDETWGHDTDDDWDYELRMKWNLQDYIFNPDMLRVSAETQDQVEFRQSVLNEVTKLFFDRKRLKAEMLIEPRVDVPTQIKRQLRLEEITASLDSMTGGFFSDEIRKRTAPVE